ncbi:ATP-binding cassette domain-containing protein [Algicola sagamiensis]|uniref:ATP-binding cassette domain-containing protein n=1 Tax=Algicola sagamiensis TaxID=163869 RepID=UPI0003718480|nr:ABC transporter ATP-binding protein [Algicola sagamiensis]
MSALLEVHNLCKNYPMPGTLLYRQQITALYPLTFTLERQQSLAIIGEAGSGKSTLARLLAGVEKPTSGDIILNGYPLTEKLQRQRHKDIRLIFQDAKDSLSPGVKIGSTLDNALKLNTDLAKEERIQKIGRTLIKVGLLPEHAEYYPHMLSGGQLQRIALARALILDPQIVILDEALGALDPSIRAQIVNLLLELQESMHLSYIIVTHQLNLVKHMSDNVLVLNEGKLVESNETNRLFMSPTHEYTQRMIASRNI